MPLSINGHRLPLMLCRLNQLEIGLTCVSATRQCDTLNASESLPLTVPSLPASTHPRYINSVASTLELSVWPGRFTHSNIARSLSPLQRPSYSLECPPHPQPLPLFGLPPTVSHANSAVFCVPGSHATIRRPLINLNFLVQIWTDVCRPFTWI